MSIKEQFKRAFIRRLAYIAAAFFIATLASLAGMGKASAHEPRPCSAVNPNSGCDQGDALTAAKDVSQAIAHCTATGYGPASGYSPAEGWTAGARTPTHNDGMDGTGSYTTTYFQKYTGGNGYEQTCGSDSFNYGESCESRNATAGPGGFGANKWVKDAGTTECLASCEFKIVGNPVSKAIYATTPGQAPVQTGTLFGGTWEFTGLTCSAPPGESPKPKEPQPPDKPECVPAGSGRTYCIKPNQDFCATASSGRTFCWTPGQEGRKTDGPNTQEVKPGSQPPAAPEGSSHTQTTTVNTTTNTSSSTTTINNYTTNNGSPAGSSNQGEGTDGNGAPGGSGSGSGGSDPDGDDDTASGGSGCESPPTSSGNAILGAILTQTYETRCAIEKGLGSLEGEGECSAQGTVVAFNCSGDTVGCALALRARERGCKEAQANQDLRDDGLLDQGDEPDGEIWGTEDGMPSLNPGLISLGGGQLLPTIDIEGQSVNLDEKIQGPIAAIRALVIAAFMVLAAFIAGGRP